MADLTKSEVMTFNSERTLNEYLRSGVVSEIIAIVPKMTHFVLFHVKKDDKKLKKSKGDLTNG